MKKHSKTFTTIELSMRDLARVTGGAGDTTTEDLVNKRDIVVHDIVVHDIIVHE